MSTAGFFLDPALTTPIVSALRIVQHLGASPVRRMVYFGLPRTGGWVRNTNGGDIMVAITGDAAGDIALSETPDALDAAIPGEPLALGPVVIGGPAGARRIWLRIDDSTGAPGERSFAVTVSDTEDDAEAAARLGAFSPAFTPAAFVTEQDEEDSASGAFSGVAFSPVAFSSDVDGGSGAVGSSGFDGLLAVVDGAVFETGNSLSWSPTVMIGDVDVSARLSGRITITAAEDSARLATLDVMPLSAAELAEYDSAPLTIDITIFTQAGAATIRRFTGRVEAVDHYDPVTRIATITGRDGWQERPAACTTAEAVEALLGGLAQPCAEAVKWEGNGSAYFSALLPTMIGATAIDSDGIWQAVPWAIGSPATIFGAGDIYNATVRLWRPSRRSVPMAISATLSRRFHRLHASAIHVYWTAPAFSQYMMLGIPAAPKSMVIDAIGQLASDGWLPMTEPKITGPEPGHYSVIFGGATHHYIVTPEGARVMCQSVDVTLYRRWYQQATAKYTVTIAMGGLSERDDAVNVSIDSDFDASAWESPPTTTSAPGVYLANGPETPSVPTGYAALRAPWPPIGGALDHLDDADMSPAIRHVVGRAVRRAAAGKRQQKVLFERPIDPRWEIGDVLGIDCYGIAATGQVAGFEERLDIDSGEAVSVLTIACPDGTPGHVGNTQYTVSAILPPPTVNNYFAFTPAATHIGARGGMGPPLNEAGQRTLNGFLCNVLPTGVGYADYAPHYLTQWRIVAPEIPAARRDPLEVEIDIDVEVMFSGSGVTVEIA